MSKSNQKKEEVQEDKKQNKKSAKSKTVNDKNASKKKETKDQNKKIKENNETNEKKESKGILHKYLWYFIIFSLLGLLIEIIYTTVTNLIFNSGVGFILGPLCIIYGEISIIVIALLQKYSGHKIKLFICGAAICTVIEFLLSFLLEGIFRIRFWDYFNVPYNLSGRVCLVYSIILGIGTVITIDILKKLIDFASEKIKGKARKIVDIIICVVLVIYTIFAVWAVATYVTRISETINGKNYISNNNFIEKFQNTAFSNEIMSSIYPRMKILDLNDNLVYISDFIK